MGVRDRLRGVGRRHERRVNRREDADALRHRRDRRAVCDDLVGLVPEPARAAESAPLRDRQHELDAGFSGRRPLTVGAAADAGSDGSADAHEA